jgi:hypothetical protein
MRDFGPMAEEWRVEVELGSEEHGLRLGGLLRGLDLDDEARRRLGDGVIVTRDGPHVFMYAADEQVARAAEQVARELVEREGVDAQVRLTRWHPVEEDWKDANTPLPETPAEEAAEAARHQAIEASEGTYDWEVRVDAPSLGHAREIEAALEAEGLAVKRRWRHLVVGVASEERAREVAEGVRRRVAAAHVDVEPAAEIPHPLSVWVSAHTPGIARDLGIDI